MALILEDNEISLYGTRFKIVGPVQQTLIDPLPAKITTGEHTRDDDVIASSWIQDDWTGGLGVEFGRHGATETRYFYGNLDTRFPAQLSLPPKVTKRSDLGPASILVDYKQFLYMVVGSEVYRWSETLQSFGEPIHTLASPASDAVVHRDVLYIATYGDDGIESFDGEDWTFEPVSVRHLAVWNATLYGLEFDGTLQIRDVDVDGEVKWVKGPKLDMPPGWATQLITYYDITEATALYAVTRSGLWTYDTIGTAGWVESQFTYPVHPKIGRASVWQGSLYVPVGQTIYRFTPEGVQVVGPDRDQGLPTEFRGVITQTVATHGFLYATIDAAQDVSEDDFSAINIGYHDGNVIVGQFGSKPVLLCSPGSAWHIQYWGEVDGEITGAAYVSNAEGMYRLWFSGSRGIYSVDLPISLHNPMRNPTTLFARSGYLVTSWFDGRWPELPKLALSVKASARHLSGGNRVSLYIQVDREDSEWIYVGRVTQEGRQTLPLSWERGGRPFRKIRFRVELERGTEETMTPILESLILTYLRRPAPVWGTQFVIDLTKPHRNQSVSELRRKLAEIHASVEAGEFYFYPEDSNQVAMQLVVPSRAVSMQIAGTDQRGRYPMSVIQVGTL